MNCKKCERAKSATLTDGRLVCTWCMDWMIECEARHLLTMPLTQRREAMAEREQRRGSIDELKIVMARIHQAKR